MKNHSSHKRFRLSLTAQVNFLIILITLSVSLVVVAINTSYYHRAVLVPPIQKMSDIEIKEEVFTHSSITEESEADETSLPVEFTDAALHIILRSLYPDEAWAEIVKDGAICLTASSLDRLSSKEPESDRSDLENIFITLSPADYLSPSLLKIDSEYLMIRCISFALDGSEVQLWLASDQTETVKDYHQFMINSVLFVILMTAAASIVSILLLGHYVTEPICALAEAANQFQADENGLYSADRISGVEIRFDNELGDLSREIRSMQTRIVENTEKLQRIAAEKERTIIEMSLSAQIQESALPNTFPAFPERKEFDLFASMKPAKEVGGDFYDYFLIDEDHLVLVIADVSGKGIPAALFMMVTKAILKNSAMAGKSVGRVLEVTNKLICENNKAEMFVTVWMGILEISTGKITAANAGHEYPVFMRGGSFLMYKDLHGIPIGGISGASYTEYELELEKGDKLFVYTDGLPEATNKDGEMFGTERMIDALNVNVELSPKEILSGMKNAVAAFVGEAEPFDDLTMLCLEYFPSDRQEPSS